MAQPNDPDIKRETFIRTLFGLNRGYIAVAVGNQVKKLWRESTFQYPDDIKSLIRWVSNNRANGNIYFCPQLLKSDRVAAGQKSARTKDNVESCPVLWADLDTCAPNNLLVEPSMVVESSPGRYHGFWILEEAIDPEDAQRLCKSIAYYHADDGADKTGWDLTQLLRIPFTNNFKYEEGPEVSVTVSNRLRYTPESFEVYAQTVHPDASSDPIPELLPTEEPLEIMQRYRKSLNPVTFNIFDIEPNEDWSKAMWQLLMLLFEAGVSREEAFVIAGAAACNKYKRDGRNQKLLWDEVCRAYAETVEKLNILIPETTQLVPLISESELRSIEGLETYIERYIKWGSSLGDAAVQYHQASAFMTLSAILAGSIRLPTSFGTIMPNLWFMILADTTLTRKSTAMDVSMELVDEIDPDILLATDGSLEGLMTAMESRPGRPSVFLRDEFSGLIEAMTKKDYLAGMAEALTKLYDGKTMKRILKRETITVREPCLLIFAGGIKNRVQSMLSLDHVSSGFIPRFLFITAESDVSKLKPLGPPTMQNMDERNKLVEELQTLNDKYVSRSQVMLKGALIGVQTEKHEAQLTEAAWARYNILESTLLYSGIQSDQPDIMTPVYDRLAKSTLKAAVLIAASRAIRAGPITVEVEDLLIALKYATHWRDYALEIINGIGRSASEVEMQRIYKSIVSHPGVSRSRIMQWYHLESRRADIIFATLEQRGLITGTRMGRTTVYHSLGRIQL